jgi:F420-0:gamma-glutamyl ligase
MEFIKVKTRKLQPPQDNIYDVLNESLPHLQDGDIIFFASKVISIHQGRCVRASDVSKSDLILQEAEYSMLRNNQSYVTVINHAFALNAGLDPYGNYYVLLPFNPQQIAKELHDYLKQKYKLDKLGIIITDSHSTPLRRGVMGYAVGYHGINPINDPKGRADYSSNTVNVVDSLASMGVLYLGESQHAEAPSTPIVIAMNIDIVEFTEKDYSHLFFVDSKEDLFAPLMKFFKKKDTT